MEEINLYNLMRFYAKNWLLLISSLIIGATIGLIYTGFIQTPMYRSEASVVVTGIESNRAPESIVIQNYVNLFKSNRVLEPIANESDYNGNVNNLRANTTTVNEEGSDFISLSMSSSDPNTSQKSLESAIENFKNEATALYGDSQITINTVDAASKPQEPYNVNTTAQITLAMAAIFMLMVIMLFFIYDYRSSRKDEEKQKTESNDKEAERVVEAATEVSGSKEASLEIAKQEPAKSINPPETNALAKTLGLSDMEIDTDRNANPKVNRD